MGEKTTDPKGWFQRGSLQIGIALRPVSGCSRFKRINFATSSTSSRALQFGMAEGLCLDGREVSWPPRGDRL